jgi:cell division transport system permease protein
LEQSRRQPRSPWRSAGFFVRQLLRSARLSLGFVTATTVAATVALACAGGAWVTSQSVTQLTTTGRARAEAIVFLAPGTDSATAQSIGASLSSNPVVASALYVDSAAAKAEFDAMVTDPALRDATDLAALPTSWRLRFHGDAPPEAIAALLTTTRANPQTYRVVDPTTRVQRIRDIGRTARWLLAAGAALVLGLWAILTTAAHRVATRARRMELSVMRQVGAHRSIVYGPSLALGALTGLVAGGGATAIVRAATPSGFRELSNRSTLLSDVLNGATAPSTSALTAVLPVVGLAIGLALAVISTRRTGHLTALDAT